MEERIAQACQRAGRSPSEVTLIAATKTAPPSAIRDAFTAGLRNFGENRVQEARAKIGELADLTSQLVWHMVGKLQTNKVNMAIGTFDIIHSVDSLNLARTLSQRAQVTLPILIQVNVAGEATKGGFSLAEAKTAIEDIARLPHLEVRGLMTIAPMAEKAAEVRPVFRQLHLLGQALGLAHLSMGMTDDFEVAIEEGATLVRIGRAIFGERPAKGDER